MDETHLWEALRYVELNPVRISLVASPEDWRWSSAAAHCGTGPAASWPHRLPCIVGTTAGDGKDRIQLSRSFRGFCETCIHNLA